MLILTKNWHMCCHFLGAISPQLCQILRVVKLPSYDIFFALLLLHRIFHLFALPPIENLCGWSDPLLLIGMLVVVLRSMLHIWRCYSMFGTRTVIHIAIRCHRSQLRMCLPLILFWLWSFQHKLANFLDCQLYVYFLGVNLLSTVFNKRKKF